MAGPLARAVAWACLGATAFAAGSAAAKFLGQSLAPGQLTCIRAAIGALVLITLWRAVRDLRSARDPAWHVARAVLGIVSVYAFMTALASVPLALVSLIFFTRVLMLPVVARLLLGERSDRVVWMSVALGFSGAVVSLYPVLVLDFRPAVLAALVAAVASAGSQTAVRRLVQSNPPSVVVLVYVSVSALATIPLAAPVWVTPPAADWPVLMVMGLGALVAQWAAARAFRLAPVSFMAPLDFLTIPAAAVLGFGVFGEVPSAYTIAGSLLILAGVLLTSSRSRAAKAA